MEQPAFPGNVTALVLAGGKGRRMQGQDKGLVHVNNRPLVTYVLDRIQPQVGKVVINANRNSNTYAIMGHEVVPDSYAPDEYAGPLAGILSGLAVCTTEFMMTVPCDTPALPGDLVQRMYDELQSQQVDVVTVHDGERLQPVIMLMRTRLRTALYEWLEQGNRSVQEWLATQRQAVMQADEPAAFVNLNTTDELEAFALNMCN